MFLANKFYTTCVFGSVEKFPSGSFITVLYQMFCMSIKNMAIKM